MPQLYGFVEAAEYLGDFGGVHWTRNAVYNYWKRGKIKDPLCWKGKSPLWTIGELEEFKRNFERKDKK